MFRPFYVLAIPLAACKTLTELPTGQFNCTAQTSCLMQGDCRPTSSPAIMTLTETDLRVRQNGKDMTFTLTNSNFGENGAMSVFSYESTNQAAALRASLASSPTSPERLDLVTPEAGDQRLTVFSCTPA